MYQIVVFPRGKTLVSQSQGTPLGTSWFQMHLISIFTTIFHHVKEDFAHCDFNEELKINWKTSGLRSPGFQRSSREEQQGIHKASVDPLKQFLTLQEGDDLFVKPHLKIRMVVEEEVAAAALTQCGSGVERERPSQPVDLKVAR